MEVSAVTSVLMPVTLWPNTAVSHGSLTCIQGEQLTPGQGEHGELPNKPMLHQLLTLLNGRAAFTQPSEQAAADGSPDFSSAVLLLII